MMRAEESYGERGLTPVDRLGVWMSKRAVQRAVQGRPVRRVLELGCGYRALLLRAVGAGAAECVGVDFRIDPELISSGRGEWVEDSIEGALPRLAGRSFDLVLLISVLEHLENPRDVLRAVHGLLEPGGTLLVNVPTWRGKAFLEFSAFRLGLSPVVEMNDHKMYYDQRDLWPLLVRVGFLPQEIRMRYHKFGLNLFAAARKG